MRKNSVRVMQGYSCTLPMVNPSCAALWAEPRFPRPLLLLSVKVRPHFEVLWYAFHLRPLAAFLALALATGLRAGALALRLAAGLPLLPLAPPQA